MEFVFISKYIMISCGRYDNKRFELFKIKALYKYVN